MHLDTFFNIIRRDLCVLVEDRYLASKNEKNQMNLTADVYAINEKSNEYEQIKKDVDFVDFLQTDMKMKVLPVKCED